MSPTTTAWYFQSLMPFLATQPDAQIIALIEQGRASGLDRDLILPLEAEAARRGIGSLAS